MLKPVGGRGVYKAAEHLGVSTFGGFNFWGFQLLGVSTFGGFNFWVTFWSKLLMFGDKLFGRGQHLQISIDRGDITRKSIFLSF